MFCWNNKIYTMIVVISNQVVYALPRVIYFAASASIKRRTNQKKGIPGVEMREEGRKSSRQRMVPKQTGKAHVTFMRPMSLGQPLRAFPWLISTLSFSLVFFAYTSFELKQAEGENLKKTLLPIWKQSSD